MSFSQKSIEFDGTDDYVTMGDVLGYERTQAFSVSFWFRCTQGGCCVAKLSVGSSVGWETWIHPSTGSLNFRIYASGGGSIRVYDQSQDWRDDTWHHVVFTYNGNSADTGLQMYVDGAPAGSGTYVGTLTGTIVSTNPLRFGGRLTDYAPWYGGKLDDVAIYGDVINAAEAALIYNCGAPCSLTDSGDPGNLDGYWLMGDGDTYPTILDHGPNGYSGTMVNMESADIVNDTPNRTPQTGHVVIPNIAPLTAVGGVFNQYWTFTRALRKAGWKYLASGDGTSKDTSADPALDLWGAGTVTNAGSGTAVISAPSRGRAVVSGLTGVVAKDKGRFLCISGSSTPANNHYHQIEKVLSAAVVEIDARTFAVAADAGLRTWVIRDTTADGYPSALNSVPAWILLRGPSTLKIPIAAAPSPGLKNDTFIRGENVVQATTGAEGEVIGCVFDGVATGYLVVAPRLRGTGTGVYGWDSAHVITGDISGATVTQVGTTLEYRHELVLAKDTTTEQGMIWVGCFEPVGEAADMLSDSTRLGAATAAVPPGGASDFPDFAWAVLGGASSVPEYLRWISGVYSGDGDVYGGNAQVMCADAIEEQSYSADGSWTIAIVMQHTHTGHSFQRCDNCEPGDLDPYVTLGVSGGSAITAVRTSTGPEPDQVYPTFGPDAVPGYWRGLLRGWRGRGTPGLQPTLHPEGANWTTFPMDTIEDETRPYGTPPDPYPDTQFTALIPTVNVHPFRVRCRTPPTFGTMRKGTLRWFRVSKFGSNGQLFGDKQWIQLGSPYFQPVLLAGPWDRTTDPILWA